MSSQKGFYTWGDGALMKCLSAQRCLFIPDSLEGDLASLFCLSWQFFHRFSLPQAYLSTISAAASRLLQADSLAQAHKAD